ncbi:MAG: hypothetical protein WBN04_04250 [Paracoccaceae bacterium]
MSRLGAAWRRHPVLSAGFALALAVTLFFAVRATVFAVYWADPAHRNQALEGWMTPRYVALSWHTPPEVIGTALKLQRDGAGRRITLHQIARDRGVPVEVLLQDLRAAIGAFRAAPHD